MKRVIPFAVICCSLTLSSTFSFSQHTGPSYGGLPSGVYMDNNSNTKDNARGSYTVKWTDRYNKKHEIVAPENGTLTVAFPIPFGGSWRWVQGDGSKQRTGFNAAVTWVEATFWREEDHVRIESTGHITNGTPPDGGWPRDLARVVKDVNEIISVGARSYSEGIRIATAGGQLK